MAKRRLSDSDQYQSADSDSSYDFDASHRRKAPPKSPSSRPRRVQVSKKRIKHRLESHEGTAEDLSPGESSRHPKSIHVLEAPDPVRLALLGWYSGVHTSRGMPWRKPYDSTIGPEERAQRAYEVWVSEIMLQQTQVATVIPYYNAWMEKFPTIRDLAASNIDQVNAMWKGLGYYSRASRLLAGAQKAVQDYGGRLPDTAKDMEANIPGIGRYSAGAICSIAYGERVPVLDGNVHRLMSRLLALHAPPKAKSTLDVLWAAAAVMVQDSPVAALHPGDINQALIELGSTVCKVREPNCEACPLSKWCRAYINSNNIDTTLPKGPGVPIPDLEDACTLCEPLDETPGVTVYPMKVEKKKSREELDIVSVLEWRSSADNRRLFLLVRRPESGLLAGLSEFPTISNVPKSTSGTRLNEISNAQLSELISDPVRIDVSTTGHTANPTKIRVKRPYTGEEEDGNGDGDAQSTAALRITKRVLAGDVIHVFSHIKKTYRVQWVVLEGGSEPPMLMRKTKPREEEDDEKVVKKAKTSKGKTKNAKTTYSKGAEPRDEVVDAVWTPMAQVSDANIGTGVVKVWNLAKALWVEP